MEKGLPEELAKEAGGALFTSGSYRLAVHEPGADIDIICVVRCLSPSSHAAVVAADNSPSLSLSVKAPQHVTIDDFFGTLKQGLLDCGHVTRMNALDSAAVPIMSFWFKGVDIDLLFVRLPKNKVAPDVDIDDDNILRSLDTASVKSLNGPRTTNWIVKLSPNYDNFVGLLRCVRYWAKQRGLYSNKMGFLGGVNYALLCSFINQLYPKATPATLLCKYFWVLR